MVEVYRPTHSATIDALDAALKQKTDELKRTRERILKLEKDLAGCKTQERLLDADLDKLSEDRNRMANPR